MMTGLMGLLEMPATRTGREKFPTRKNKIDVFDVAAVVEQPLRFEAKVISAEQMTFLSVDEMLAMLE